MASFWDEATESYKNYPVKRIKDSDIESGQVDCYKLPDDIIGSTILNIGTVCNHRLENPFLIDYLPKNCTKPRRIVICSTDLGMWLEGKAKL